MEIKGMRIVVAGASGLVGSALVPLLKAEGAEVTRLVRSAAGPGDTKTTIIRILGFPDAFGE